MLRGFDSRRLQLSGLEPEAAGSGIRGLPSTILGDSPGGYAGSTSLSFEVFGRHRRFADSSEPRGFALPGVTCGDT